jgi:DNA-binding LytR/AlgR family response regulator
MENKSNSFQFFSLSRTPLWLESLLFASYELLFLVVVGIHDFWLNGTYFLQYLGLFFSFLLVHFVILKTLVKRRHSQFLVLFSSFSFLITGSLVGLITWFVYDFQYTTFFSYLLAFLISSFLPTVIFYVQFLFQRTFTEMNSNLIETSNDESDLLAQHQHFFQLKNNAGKTRLKIESSQIICFEANDNYVNIYYLDSNAVFSKVMERISLKKIETLLPDSEDLFYRVHKSYLINKSFIKNVVGKSQAYKLKMQHYDNEIPVSRLYDISILKLD